MAMAKAQGMAPPERVWDSHASQLRELPTRKSSSRLSDAPSNDVRSAYGHQDTADWEHWGCGGLSLGLQRSRLVHNTRARKRPEVLSAFASCLFGV